MPPIRRQVSDVSRTAAPPMMKRQVSDISRSESDEDAAAQASSKAATTSLMCAGGLANPGPPLHIVFLDIDGVLAPRVNAGQIVKQCVDAVVALCRVADARIVMSSSWRLLDDKAAEFAALLVDHHGAEEATPSPDARFKTALLYDVTPDLRGAAADEPPDEVADAAFREHFIRVHERHGLSLDDVRKAARLLRAPESRVATLDAVFCDADYDVHVYSEVSRKYSRASFSPRSRKGEDWTHEACSAGFARTRRCEVQRWLTNAAKCGVEVDSYVVLDDDDLLLTGAPPAQPVIRSAVSTAAAVNGATATVPAAAADEEDDAWAFAF